ncbi:unnamed protein product [Prunus armeniaca]
MTKPPNSPENEEKSSGFDRNFAGFVLRRPATDSGNVGNSIYELDFGWISRGDSGHFRVGVLSRDFGFFQRWVIALDTHALPERVNAQGHCRKRALGPDAISWFS